MQKITLLYTFILLIIIPFSHLFAERPLTSQGNFIWHWHLGHAPEENVFDEIEDLKIKGIFLHIGEFSYFDERVQFRPLQFNIHSIENLKKNKNLKLHLTFTFSGCSRFPFSKYFHQHTDEAIPYVLDIIDGYLNIATCQKITISGIQLDMEGKINLKKYKKLIDCVVKRYGEEYLISISPPVYWYGKEDFPSLIEKVDFVVPMLYDYAKDRYVSGLVRVTDTKWMKKWVKKFNKLKKPFYAGIPTYSYSVIYNEQGKRIVSWAKSSPEELSQSPDFKLIKTKRSKMRGTKGYDGDNLYVFEAKRDTILENYELKKGAKVKINLITPAGIAKYIEVVKKLKTKNFLGISFFRYGYSREELVAGYDEIKEAFFKEGRVELNPEVEILFDRQRYIPLRLDKVITVNILLKNTGNKESFCTTSSNKVFLDVTNGHFVKFKRGDFEEVNPVESNPPFLFSTKKTGGDEQESRGDATNKYPTSNGVKIQKRRLIFKEYLLSEEEVAISGSIHIKVEELPLILKCQAEIKNLDEEKRIYSPQQVLKIYEDTVEKN